jgi:adenine-specific DNA-methyltransferase
MARLRAENAPLAADIEQEISALTERRPFGLNFERHVPEAVELAGRKVRRGDKVRVLPPRGEKRGPENDVIWTVAAVNRAAGTASIESADVPEVGEGEPLVGMTEVALDDLVVVAEFRDPIYPGLVSVGRVERGGDKPFHTVINGENFHALEALLYAYEGQVDCIYIDPPYNTGARDWKYNNDYVEAEDTYRHSKWLSFMEKRLKVAKRLLNPADSVLIVTIDEKEYLRLGMLLEQLFPEAQIQMVTACTNKKGSSRPGRFSRSDEYLYFVFLGQSVVAHQADNMLTSDRAETKPKTIWNSLLRRGDAARRRDRPNMFFPVWIEPDTGRIVSVGDALPLGEDRTHSIPPSDGLVASWPLRSDGSEGRWQVGAPRLRRLVADGQAKAGAFNKQLAQHAVLFLKSGQIDDIKAGRLVTSGSDEQGALVLSWADSIGEGRQAPRTLWVRDAHDASIYGSTLLRAVLPGRKFPFPKSLYAVEDTLRFVVANKPEAIVIDFFGGSGTTAHAVMRLNRQDDGRRRSIVVTNNEVSDDEAKALTEAGHRPGDPEWEALGIFEHITRPRIEAAVTGLTPDGNPVVGDYKFTDEFPMADGFKENVEFLTLTHESPLSIATNRAFGRIAPLLWMRAGARGRRIEHVDDGWDVADTYGVIADLDRSEEFRTAVAAAGEDLAVVFIITDEDRLFEAVARDLPEHVEPVRLYESYMRTFEAESGRGAL